MNRIDLNESAIVVFYRFSLFHVALGDREVSLIRSHTEFYRRVNRSR